MTIHCIVVDDEPALVELLSLYVRQTPGLNLLFATTSPKAALAFMEKQPVQLVFLDVEMAEMTGLEFIKAVSGKCRIVLCTGHARYALDGFENDVVDFLLKPVTAERFARAVEKAQKMILTEQPPATEKDHLFIVSGAKSRHLKIYYNDIDYIRSLKNYTAFYYGGKKLVSRINISALEQQLPAGRFLRVHVSYIIPLGKVISFDAKKIQLNNIAREIPIGGTYKESVFKKLKQ